METIAALFIAASFNSDLPPGLLESLCWVETKHQVSAVHQDDGGSASLGICQVKWVTAQWLGFEGTEDDLMRPDVNIYYASKYLAYQLNRYPGSVEKAVIAYNRGHAGLLTSTKYSDKVMNKWRNGYL